MSISWDVETPQIEHAAEEFNVDPFFIAAIRQAENGPPGKDYGVEVAGVDTYSEQLQSTCASVRHRLVTYAGNPLFVMRSATVDRLVYSNNFIAYFQSIWAPIGADNDPAGENKNWLKNAGDAYHTFVLLGRIG